MAVGRSYLFRVVGVARTIVVAGQNNKDNSCVDLWSCLRGVLVQFGWTVLLEMDKT